MHAFTRPCLAGDISLGEIMAAGLFVSGVMLLLGATGAMGLLHAAVPPSVIRGVQLAVGLALAQKVRRADVAPQQEQVGASNLVWLRHA